MPTITWPSTLPQPLTDGYGETPPNNVITWSADQGATHTRLKGTSAPRYLRLKYKLSVAELATLDTFYTTTSVFGSLPFNFTHPRTGAVLVAQFNFKDTPIDYSSLANLGVVAISLEILA